MKDFLGKKSIMTVLLGIIWIFSSSTTTFAEQTDNVHVLKIEDEGKTYLYGSRYQCQILFLDSENGSDKDCIYWNAPEIINLVSGEGEKKRSIAAYCLDGITACPAPGACYRRINLEDHQQFDADTASRLRAILLNSFPSVQVEEIAVRVNEVMGEGSLRELTQGEVLTATQQAIWEIAKGEVYSVDRNYVSIRGLSQYNTSEFVYPDSLNACTESEYTRDNITNLYRYFLQLEPIGPIKKVLTEESVRDIGYEAQMQADGTYTVTVSYGISTVPSETDELNLSIACGQQLYQKKLEHGMGICLFSGLAEPVSALITVSGYQNGEDVYLFEKNGDPSDLLIGHDSSQVQIFIQKTLFPGNEAKADRELPAEDPTMQNDNLNKPTIGLEGCAEENTAIEWIFRLMGAGFCGTAIVLMIIHASKRERH